MLCEAVRRSPYDVRHVCSSTQRVVVEKLINISIRRISFSPAYCGATAKFRLFSTISSFPDAFLVVDPPIGCL